MQNTVRHYIVQLQNITSCKDSFINICSPPPHPYPLLPSSDHGDGQTGHNALHVQNRRVHYVVLKTQSKGYCSKK
jgi:hypothetical protein